MLEHGAHLDSKNDKGQTPLTLIDGDINGLNRLGHPNLQCICARTIAQIQTCTALAQIQT